MAVTMRAGCRGCLVLVHPLRALRASPSLCQREDENSQICANLGLRNAFWCCIIVSRTCVTVSAASDGAALMRRCGKHGVEL